MSINNLELFLNWMTQHTIWVNIFIFAIAMSESMLVIGLIVPGFLLMVGFGALIATGHLNFWPTVLITISGAIAGDGLSYWLGKHYQQQIQNMWPLSRYPTLIKQGQVFFNKHGKKSVALGRFFGPLRAIVPTIAGTANMPATQFYISNILSAMLWAPLYLLPGIIFGMSLQLAKEFAGQFALLIVVTIVLILLVAHTVRSIYGWLTPQADVLSYRLLIWARNHPILGVIPNSLVNPKKSEVRAISVFGFLLAASSFSLVILNHYLFDTLLLNNIDTFIEAQLLLLQHPLTTNITNFLSAFSHYNFIISSVALFSIWSFYIHNYKAIFFILTSLLLPWSVIFFISVFNLSFDSFFQHYLEMKDSLFILAISVYGYITIYFTKSLAGNLSRISYTLIILLLFSIAFSQLYLGLQLFSTLLGHFLFGICWVSVLGIAYRRHPVTSSQRKKIFATIIISVSALILLALVFSQSIKNTTKISLLKNNTFIMGYEAWLDSGWKILPRYRNDLRAYQQQPLNIQWASNEVDIVNLLKANHWQQVENSTVKYFNWLKNISTPSELAIVNHIHNGQYNTLTFSKRRPSKRLAIIRLWPSSYHTQSVLTKNQLWIGEISFSEISYSPFLNYLTTVDNVSNTLELLKNNLNGNYETRHYSTKLKNGDNLEASVLLIK